MRDFVAFGKDNFLRPDNILEALDEEISVPDIRLWAFLVYRLILVSNSFRTL